MKLRVARADTIADEFQNSQEKVFILQQDADLKNNELKSQKQKFDQIIKDMEGEKNNLIEEVEILKESERRLKTIKIQNEHLTGKLDDYHDTQKKLNDYKQEVKQLEDANKKLLLELQEKQGIGEAVDYLKESNVKAATRLYQLELDLKDS